MTRYFFNVINGDFTPDTQGIECATLEDAKAQAIVIAGEMLRDQGLKVWGTRHFDMFVTDQENRTCLKLALSAEDLTDNGNR